MIRIVQIGDTHLGYRAGKTIIDGRNLREQDTLEAFNTVCDQIAAHAADGDIDIVLHTGDLFDMPRPSYRIIADAVRGLRKITATGVPLVLIAGNHDISRIKVSGSVFDVLTSLNDPNLHVVAGYDIEKLYFDLPVGSVEVVCTPYGALMNSDPAGHSEREFFPQSDYRLAVAHGSLEGTLPNIEPYAGFDFSRKFMPVLPKENGAHHFALGHLHTLGEVGDRILYNGSINRFGRSDMHAEPGWWYIETDDDTWSAEHKPVASRKIVDLGEYVVSRGATDDDEARIATDIATAFRWHDEPLEPLVWVTLKAPRNVYRRMCSMIAEAAGGCWNLTILREEPGPIEGLDGKGGQNVPNITLGELLVQYAEAVLKEKHGDTEGQRIADKMGMYLNQAMEEGHE